MFSKKTKKKDNGESIDEVVDKLLKIKEGKTDNSKDFSTSFLLDTKVYKRIISTLVFFILVFAIIGSASLVSDSFSSSQNMTAATDHDNNIINETQDDNITEIIDEEISLPDENNDINQTNPLQENQTKQNNESEEDINRDNESIEPVKDGLDDNSSSENTNDNTENNSENKPDNPNERYEFIENNQAYDLFLSDDSVVILDIRFENFYDYEHINGSISIPLITMFSEDFNNIFMDELENKTIILYGEGRDEEKSAYNILNSRNIKSLYILEGGIDSWKDEGYPVKSLEEEYDIEELIDSSLENDKPVFVFVYSKENNYCSLQRMILRGLEKIFSDHIEFVFVNNSENNDFVDSLNIDSFPYMFLIVDKDGSDYLYKVFSDFSDKSEISSYFKKIGNNILDNFDSWWNGKIEAKKPVDLPVNIKNDIDNGESENVIIKYNKEEELMDKFDYLNSTGFRNIRFIPSKKLVAGLIDKSVFNRIKYDSDIVSIHEDHEFSVFLDDSLSLIDYYDAFSDYGLTGKDVKICILDTGIDSNVVDYSYGYDFIEDDSLPDDAHGHGTMVASIIDRIAPDAELVVAKVINQDGTGYESTVLEGLEWCIQQNPDIISFSIGTKDICPGFCIDNFVVDLANEAVTSHDVFVIAAAGNDARSGLCSPACGRNVFSVGATDDNDNIAVFSNIHPILDCMAPGVDIDTDAGMGSGTSMSTPFVAGAAALLLEKDEDFEPEELRYRFRSTGIPIFYRYNDSLSFDIPRLDIFNLIENNVTMTPFNYTDWLEEGLDDEEYETKSTVTYYFSRGDIDGFPAEEWTTNPRNMYDGDEDTDSRTSTNADVENMDGNTCPATNLGTISKVELRAYGRTTGSCSGSLGVALRPVFSGGDGNNHDSGIDSTEGWGDYVDITSDTNNPGIWSWSDVRNLDVDVQSVLGGMCMNAYCYCSKVEIRVTYTSSNNAPSISSFSVDGTGNGNEWDQDNDDIQIDYTVTDDDSDTLTLYFTYKYGGAPSDPSSSNYDGILEGISSGKYSLTNVELPWREDGRSDNHESGTSASNWDDTTNDVYIKMIAYDTTDYSDTNTDTTLTGIDGTAPTIADVTDTYGEEGDDDEVYLDQSTDTFYFSNSFDTDATVQFSCTFEDETSDEWKVDYGSFGADDPSEDTSSPYRGTYTINDDDTSGSITVTVYDNAGNTDTGTITCTEDTTKPSSSIDSITSYEQSISDILLNSSDASDADAGLNKLTLWYRWSDDNSTWGSWMENNTDTASDWQWNFNFTNANGTGYYEFYSISVDNVGNQEDAPPTADARCYYSYTQNTSISITPSSWVQGTLTIGTTNETDNNFFNLTNDGNVAINVQIKADNATTGSETWAISSSPGYDDFAFQFDTAGSWNTVEYNFTTFCTNLIAGNSQSFDLKLFLATASSTIDPMQFEVTFRSVAS